MMRTHDGKLGRELTSRPFDTPGDAWSSLRGRAVRGLGAGVVILGGTVFTGWDIVMILLFYVGLPLLVLIALIVGVVMFVRRARR